MRTGTGSDTGTRNIARVYIADNSRPLKGGGYWTYHRNVTLLYYFIILITGISSLELASRRADTEISLLVMNAT
jgi:hypothetical protein